MIMEMLLGIEQPKSKNTKLGKKKKAYLNILRKKVSINQFIVEFT